MKHYPHIFSPIKVGNVIHKNRIILPPQNPHICAHGAVMAVELMEFFRKFAQGGAGQITLGVTAINADPNDGLAKYMLPVYDDSSHIGLTRFANMAHMFGCVSSIELFAIAKIGCVSYSDESRADDTGKNRAEVAPEDLSIDDINAIVKAYADAAERCVKAGIDTILIHGAHGFLPGAFFSPVLNGRTDEFGADTLETRVRFTDLVIDTIRARVGHKINIEWRLGVSDLIPGSPTPDELVWFVRHIQDRIDLVHLSKGLHNVHAHAPLMFPALYVEHGLNIEEAAYIKQRVDIPVAVVGGITLDQAEEAIAAGKVDMVAMARGLYADPNLPRLAKAGRADEIRPCVRCNNCINQTHQFLHPVVCAVNAEHGNEVIYKLNPDPKGSRRVAVIGGGPGGMEAARTASERGHKVVLFEKENRLGGMLNVACVPWFKQDIKTYIDWAIRMTMRDPNIEVRMCTEATPEMLKAENFDVVIVANGGSPIMPGFVRGKKNCAWVGEVETGKAHVGNKVVITGAGLAGCEAAWALAEQGKDVTIVDMLPQSMIGQGGAIMNMTYLKNKLNELGVKIICEVKVEDVTDEGVVVSGKDGAKQTIPCESVVVAFGITPNTELGEKLRDELDCEVVCIGDCATRQGTLRNSISMGHVAAYDIF